MTNSIKNGIKEIRLSKGISELDLANELNVDTAVLDSWESGIIYPSAEILRKISRYLDSSMDMLLLSDKRSPLIIEDLSEEEKASIMQVYKDIKRLRERYDSYENLKKN